MKKSILLIVAVLFLVISCVNESEADASGKIKEAELALKTLRQILDKYNTVYGHFPVLQEDVETVTKTAELVVNEEGIKLIVEEFEVYMPTVDSEQFYEGLGKVMELDESFVIRRWTEYVRANSNVTFQDTIDSILEFDANENLSAIIRLKDTSAAIAIRIGDETTPYHIYKADNPYFLTVSDSALISFIPGTYQLSFKELIADIEKQENRNAAWLFDTLSQFGDTAELKSIKEAIIVDSLRYITIDPYRKYFLSASATDRNHTVVTVRRIIRGSNDISPDNFISMNPEAIANNEEMMEDTQ